MTATTLPPSLWTAMARPAPDCPALEGERRADVCVVGGGYTGLSAALHLAEGGADAVLLEAVEPGYGASRRTAGPAWSSRSATSGASPGRPSGRARLFTVARR